MTRPSIENPQVAVIDDGDDRTRMLAERAALTLLTSPHHKDKAHKDKTTQTSSQQFTLQWLEDKLTLQDHSKKTLVNISIDFTEGRALHRLKFGGGHGQELARAIKSREHPIVCDATAGLGKDAFVLASLGCSVVLFEQSIIVHALLEDAIRRARAHPDTKEIAQRMELHNANSTHLPQCWPHEAPPQVVYLDPMYPDAKRTAKKEIQALRTLLETAQADTALKDQEDAMADYETALLNAARSTARRVVVKRPRKALALAGVTPSGNITSPNTRYDIYGS